jgi:hypothetical protein
MALCGSRVAEHVCLTTSTTPSHPNGLARTGCGRGGRWALPGLPVRSSTEVCDRGTRTTRACVDTAKSSYIRKFLCRVARAPGRHQSELAPMRTGGSPESPPNYGVRSGETTR